MFSPKKIFLFVVFLCFSCVFFYSSVSANEPKSSELYALSACLMDADSGRILYQKDGDVIRANASTTKIMTCILALEYGNPEDLVTVSKYAASMPDVQLNINTEEQYRLKDLLYSLMLESHNDSAVAIAEHIAGSVKEFSVMMNEKAAEIGCKNTHFITPNGLDATETIDGVSYIHGTTASDLCLIMAYCIQNEQFLQITQTISYSFTNYVSGDAGSAVPGKRSFTVNNKNAFLSMMEGVISGKTGFTGDAGYCYVTALKQGERTYTVALLGCGWPNNKTYKWHDAKLLLNYGLEQFSKQDICDYDYTFPEITVKNGIFDDSLQKGIFLDKQAAVPIYTTKNPLIFLIKEDDRISVDYNFEHSLTAPVGKNQAVGSVTYSINDVVVQKYNIYTAKSVKKINFSFCLEGIWKKFFLSF